ncbi:2-keto-4-pentenoate hydratase [Neobacillus terrae]|uniref:2-keto-4-pentenoate hydratase n=1 Tax=Neobacillus terrae TaxID=3034837 RepID=UPI0014092E8E|nr:fumarylacetoacetate hydrolase family protein [Neobacillus terrae]NHM32845.1 4-oxalocrotonate decarboxylase [Neobacillus terrae]
MNLNEIADELYQHQKNGEELEKLTERYTGLTPENSYEIQKINIQKDLLAGDHLTAWKMGLTSLAKQQSVGISEPIYGRLLKSMEINSPLLNLKGLIHPRVEPEFAFFINQHLEGADITEEKVWKATIGIAPALEVIDSRYRDFSFNLVDVVADNASSSRFILSKNIYSPTEFQLDQLEVSMELNGKTVQIGRGSAVLGNPVRSVVKLVQMLHSVGESVEPGMIVLTGGITEAVPVSIGDNLIANFEKLGRMKLSVKS